MPLYKTSHPKRPGPSIWIQTESGYQKTCSPLLITNSLERLREERRFVTLTNKKYVSGNTVLVDFSTKHLEIDRPLDWPLQMGGPVFVRFLDRANLLNYYKAKVIKVTDNSILTEFPVELFQLQRRQFYRVSVPGLNNVTLQCKGNECSGLIAQDLSIRGILISKKSGQIFDIGDEVENLCLEIHSSGKSVYSQLTISLQAQQGQVVRLDKNSDLNQYIAGLKLFPDRKEEKILQKYIHQRELRGR
nr:PilZ domain-containing protein [Desulfobulbaceae bacterium]